MYSATASYNIVEDDLLYMKFLGMQGRPFSLTPDVQFYFSHQSAQDAMNKLVFAVRSGEGFTKLTGEIGTGKTMLCRTFLANLGDDYVSAYIPNPYVSPQTLLCAIADEFGIAYSAQDSQHELLKSLTHFLIDTYAQTGRRVVICLDDAHAMPLHTMEMLRILSNLETPKRKLLQLVLFGQPELDTLLEEKSLRQLKQRITFSARLGALSAEEVEEYVQHRIRIAGYRGGRLFTAMAMRRLVRTSGGVPRLINIFAHKALIAAYSQRRRKVRRAHMQLAIEDSHGLVNKSVSLKMSNSVLYFGLLLAGSVASALLSYISHMP